MNLFQKTQHVLGSRLALNLYFWLFLLGAKLSDADDQTAYSQIFYYGMMVFYLGFFVLLSYVNNLILLPKLLFKHKRALYLGAAFVLIFVVAYTYTFFMKWIPLVIPGFDAMATSIVMFPVTDDLSPAGILKDMDDYIFMLIIWTAVFTLLGYYHHNVEKVKTMENALHKHRETELNFLKNQINPHFLFNTLNNLYALALKKSDEAPDAILKLSSILRYILYEADAKMVSFEKEKDIMQAYIDIELLRLHDSPDLQFSITADRECVIPPLMWLPILENVFKHSRQVEALEVDFQFSIRQNMLKIFCKNNTIPKPVSPIAVGGIGLSNLRKRLELLYPEKHKLSVTHTENYFIIDVEINLI